MTVIILPAGDATIIHVFTDKGQWSCRYADVINLTAAEKIAAESFSNGKPLDERNWTAF